MSVAIPKYIVEFFLSGRTRPGAIQRFTQTGGIVSDVWFAFAKDLSKPVRVLIAPTDGVSAVDVGHVLHTCIMAYRKTPAAAGPLYPAKRFNAGVSPLENFVAVTLYLDELLRIVLPLTSWWSEHGIGRLNKTWNKEGPALQLALRSELSLRLKDERETPAAPKRKTRGRQPSRNEERRIRETAPIAALIGAYILAPDNQDIAQSVPKEETVAALPKDRIDEVFADLVWKYADPIIDAAIAELSREIPTSVFDPALSASSQLALGDYRTHSDPPPLISRVFLDREVGLAVTEGVCTIKSDAANRLFDLSCRNLTWAIIDSGIDSKHPAFKNHEPSGRGRSRVKVTLDFTPIEQIRSFDLIADEAGSDGRQKAIDNVIQQLRHLPDYPALPAAEFETVALANLTLIADQLERRLQPDWSLIEPLIQRRPAKDDEDEPERTLTSHHGTHVAGILGADWREARGKDDEEDIVLRGVCPDINLYDLRVIDSNTNAKNTEFAVLAACEYIQFVNRRTTGMRQVIHGVNLSLSIPHEVRSYACGATPVCVASNNLVGAGVVVVVAAGNRGWNEQEMGFGSFTFCTITDPGNAEDVITVGATHRIKPHTYGVSFFSSRGPTGDGRIKPDLVAPGEKIKGPVLDNADDELDGTSMASPFVSGAAALLIARNGELLGNPRKIKKILCESATDLGREKYFQGHGLVDVLRALQSV